MKIKDSGMRALKTFCQAFLGTLIPEVVVILTNITQYDFSNWQVWGLPILCGAIAAGLSAIQNAFINYRAKKNEGE